MTLTLDRSIHPAPIAIRVFATLQSDPRKLWPLRHLILEMRRHDLIKKYPHAYPTHQPTHTNFLPLWCFLRQPIIMASFDALFGIIQNPLSLFRHSPLRPENKIIALCRWIRKVFFCVFFIYFFADGCESFKRPPGGPEFSSLPPQTDAWPRFDLLWLQRIG